MRAISSGLSHARKTTRQVKLESVDTTSVRAWRFIGLRNMGGIKMKKNKLREMLKEGRPTLGTRLLSVWPGMVKIVGHLLHREP